MKNLLEIVLTSGTISALISGGITYMQFQKENQLKYITQERKEWRNKMRKIASRLQNTEVEKTSEVLTELKVRINTYGYWVKANEDNENNQASEKEDKYAIMHDGHIWKLISDMEELCNDEKDEKKLTKCRKQMIDYISLLLKDDWERSKNEVKGIKKIFCYALIIVSICLVVGTSSALSFWKQIEDCPAQLLIILLLLLILLVIAYIIIDRREKWKRENDYIDSLKRIDKKAK